MGKYLIRDLEKISGVKAHTIRIWEKRYNLIEPRRTRTNIRYYSDCDLKRILNISILNHNGIKISRIAGLSEEEIKSRVLTLAAGKTGNHLQVERLLIAMLELDEKRFHETLSGSVDTIGFENSYEQVVFPLLERIGILWQAGTINPAQEHFISNLVRQNLMAAINKEDVRCLPGRPRITMFLPEGETHEIGLLFYNLVARKFGADVVYLGAAVPANDLLLVNKTRPCELFMTAFVSAITRKDLEAHLLHYRGMFPGHPFFITGLQVRELNPVLPTGFTTISSSANFIEAIGKLER